MGIISYAQNFEDVLLHRVFAGLNYGFYVDIGAYHPVEDSVTKAFYDRGWSGINVEPGEVFSELLAARPRDINLNMAVYDRSGEIRFAQHPGWYAGLSHIEQDDSSEPYVSPDEIGVETRSVACDTLTNILERHGGRRALAFVKIDAEGAELAIIRSTNWRVIRPTVLLVEATLPLSTELDNEAWEPILLEQGYVRAYFDGINCFYVPEERTDLLRSFALPVNVLDGFACPEPATMATLRDDLRHTQERLAATSNELGRVQAENANHKDQNSLHVKTIGTHEKILAELRRNFDERVETVKIEYQRSEADLQAASAAQLAAARDACDAQIVHLQEHIEQRTREADARCMVFENTIAEMHQREVTLAASTIQLQKLIFELRWPNGPRALRMVLPLARTIRRLKGTKPPHPTPVMAHDEAGKPESGGSHFVSAALVAEPKRSLKKRLSWLMYRPLRPLGRPIAWRLRGFVIGEIIERLALLDQRVVGAAAALLEQRPDAIKSESQPSTIHIRDDGAAAELRRLAVEMERTLLTLALERAPEH